MSVQYYDSLVGQCMWDSRDFLLGLSAEFLLNYSLPGGVGGEGVRAPLSPTHSSKHTHTHFCNRAWALAHNDVWSLIYCTYKGLVVSLVCVCQCVVGRTEHASVWASGCLPEEQYEINTSPSYTWGSWAASNAATWEEPSACLQSA